MTLIYIDVCIASEEWFVNNINLLLNSKHIKVLYSSHPKVLAEVKKVPNLLKLLHTLRDTDRRKDIGVDILESKISYLESLSEWGACRACDDPHIFGIVYLANNLTYVITKDIRQLECRKKIGKIVDKEYLNFKIICNEKLLTRLERKRRL